MATACILECMKRALLLLPFLVLPQLASATTITLTSGSTWQVPNDWNNSSNTVECLGAGGAGGSGGTISGGYILGGGGGGAYAKSVNLSLTPASTVHISVGGDTYFNPSAASFPSSGQACGARSGGSGNSQTPGSGGSASGSYATGTGSLKTNGGSGGAGGAMGGGQLLG